MATGIPVAGILKQTGLTRLPTSLAKYFFCSPSFDQPYRCLPSGGGFYDMRYRDYLEFRIIEARLRDKQRRSGG